MSGSAVSLERLSTHTNIERWYVSPSLLVPQEIIDSYIAAVANGESVDGILQSVPQQTRIAAFIEHYKNFNTAGPYKSVPMQLCVPSGDAIPDPQKLFQAAGLSRVLVDPKFDLAARNAILISNDRELLAQIQGIAVQVLDGTSEPLENALRYRSLNEAFEHLFKLQSAAHEAERIRIFGKLRPYGGVFNSAANGAKALGGLVSAVFRRSAASDPASKENPALDVESP